MVYYISETTHYLKSAKSLCETVKLDRKNIGKLLEPPVLISLLLFIANTSQTPRDPFWHCHYNFAHRRRAIFRHAAALISAG